MYDDFLSLFDQIFSDSARQLDKFAENNNQPARYNKLMSTSQFPPANIFCNTKTKVLRIEVALAGYSEDDLNLSFDGDRLKLIVDRPDGDKSLGEDEKVEEYVMQRAIKLPKHFVSEWLIDPRYYDRDSVTVNYKDGLLTINISPRAEVAPKKIALFGNLKLEDKKQEQQPQKITE
jgi:HSP20 family molecular chaperone IbpA